MLLKRNDTGVRPAVDPLHCFYCQRPVGLAHRNDCVTLRRTVTIELKTWLVVAVPQSYTEEDVRFFLNDSSHCSGNEFQQIMEEDERVPGACCTCHRTEMRYLREATQQDHDDTNWIDREDVAARDKAKKTAEIEETSANVLDGFPFANVTVVREADGTPVRMLNNFMRNEGESLRAALNRALRPGEALIIKRENLEQVQ